MHPGTGSPRPPSLFSVAGDFLPVPALQKLNPASVTAVRPLAATTSHPSSSSSIHFSQLTIRGSIRAFKESEDCLSAVALLFGGRWGG